MFELIIEFVLEFLLQFAGELILELIIRGGSKIPWVNNVANNLLLGVIVLFPIGAFMGWFSLLFFPEAFVRSESLHGISLVITPVLAGSAMAAIGWIRERRGKPVVRIESFWFGFALAFGIALVRFYWTV